jgi:CBS domain-containing protein
MRTVRDVMQGDVELLRTSETVAEAAGVLAAQREDWLPLCQADGTLAGAVSHRDIVAEVVAKGRDPREVRLAELADPGDVVAIDVDVPLQVAVSLMCRHDRSRLPVVEGDRVVGLVTRRDAVGSLSFCPPWAEGTEEAGA